MVAVLWFKFFIAYCAAATVNNVVGASSRPNVLFLVVDDLRPKLGCYGETNMITPNIDQLAANSIKFERAYVQGQSSSAVLNALEAMKEGGREASQKTSFLTGRRPDTTRVFDLHTYWRKVAGNFTTLPQHFKNNGYITQSVGKIFHPGRSSGHHDDYPYSWSNPAYHAPTENQTKIPACHGPDGRLYRNAVCPVDVKKVPGGSLPDIQNSDFTIEFLRKRSLDKKPFFLGMGYRKPHLPFKYPKEYLDLYPMSKIHMAPNPYYPPWLPPVAWSAYGELRSYHDIAALNISMPYGLVPLDYQLKLRQSYSAATTYTDAQLGRVLHALDQYGLANNTIISLLGDHGWQLGEHGEWTKHTNFDIATRIPMMVHVPGVTARKAPPGQTFPFRDALKLHNNLLFRPEKELQEQKNQQQATLSSDAFVEATDLFATISELAGLDIPATCPNDPFHVAFCTEGASFVPVIKNLTAPSSAGSDVTWEKLTSWKPAVFSQYPRSKPVPTPSTKHAPIMGYTMKTDRHRYTEWVAYDHKRFRADWSKVYARELYIHSNDPDEDLNVADVPAFQDLAASLSRQLRAGWRQALPRQG